MQNMVQEQVINKKMVYFVSCLWYTNNMKATKISDLKQYEKNAKIHTYEDIKEMADSLALYGCVTPILLDKKNVIIAGHKRFLAFRDVLGYEKVEEKAFTIPGEKVIPVVYLHKLSEAQVIALRHAENKLASRGNYDLSLVKEDMQLLQDMGEDGLLTGYSDDLLSDPEDIESTGEVSLSSLEEDTPKIVLSYSSKDYLEVLEMLGKFKEQYEHETNEEAIISMLRQMTD